jgi:hypothetical protein
MATTRMGLGELKDVVRFIQRLALAHGRHELQLLRDREGHGRQHARAQAGLKRHRQLPTESIPRDATRRSR